MLQSSRGTFPRVGGGGPGQGELVEEEKRRQEAPYHGLQCQAWKHGVRVGPGERRQGTRHRWVPAPCQGLTCEQSESDQPVRRKRASGDRGLVAGDEAVGVAGS